MLAPFYDQLWFIPVSVFIGGIIGSPHCLSMCGPIVIHFAQDRRRLALYQIGRMIAYSLAGASAGAFGQTILGSERPAWVSNLSIALISITLIWTGYRSVAGSTLHVRLPAWIHKLNLKIWKLVRISSMPKLLGAATAGFLTVFLPCGHLYSFLVGAVATSSAIKGALFMFSFWLGSTPLLSLSGIWLHKALLAKIPGRQRWSGAILVIAGLVSMLMFSMRTQMFSKMNMAASTTQQSPAKSQHLCH